MRYYKSNYDRPLAPVSCGLSENETEVQGALAYTPSEMAALLDQGIPVSSQNVAMDIPMDDVSTFDLPLARRRHVDIVQLHDAELSARKTINTKYRAKCDERTAKAAVSTE
nr:MAG: hypothetical protein [Microvirus Sku13]